MAWLDRGMLLARCFDGYLGGGILRDAKDQNVLHAVYRFEDPEALQRWEASHERKLWLASGEPLVVAERTQRRTGIEGWFDGPRLQQETDTSGAVRTVGVRSAPQRWKQACAIWLGMFPTNLLVSVAFSLLPWWGDVHIALRVAIMVSVLAPLMTFAVMPLVTRILRPWLRRNPGVIKSERALNEALDALGT